MNEVSIFCFDVKDISYLAFFNGRLFKWKITVGLVELKCDINGEEYHYYGIYEWTKWEHINFGDRNKDIRSKYLIAYWCKDKLMK